MGKIFFTVLRCLQIFLESTNVFYSPKLINLNERYILARSVLGGSLAAELQTLSFFGWFNTNRLKHPIFEDIFT